MRATIILAATLLSIIILAACGKEGKFAVFTGRVTASDTSIYIADVRVYEKSHNRQSTVTDSLGFFRLENVSCEEHNVYFEKEDYEPFVLNFEYTGALEHPVITKLIILFKPGEEKETTEKKAEDTSDSL